MTQTSNSSNWGKLRQMEGGKFEANVGKSMRLCLNKEIRTHGGAIYVGESIKQFVHTVFYSKCSEMHERTWLAVKPWFISFLVT